MHPKVVSRCSGVVSTAGLRRLRGETNKMFVHLMPYSPLPLPNAIVINAPAPLTLSLLDRWIKYFKSEHSLSSETRRARISGGRNHFIQHTSSALHQGLLERPKISRVWSYKKDNTFLLSFRMVLLPNSCRFIVRRSAPTLRECNFNKLTRTGV